MTGRLTARVPARRIFGIHPGLILAVLDIIGLLIATYLATEFLPLELLAESRKERPENFEPPAVAEERDDLTEDDLAKLLAKKLKEIR